MSMETWPSLTHPLPLSRHQFERSDLFLGRDRSFARSLQWSCRSLGLEAQGLVSILGVGNRVSRGFRAMVGSVM